MNIIERPLKQINELLCRRGIDLVEYIRRDRLEGGRSRGRKEADPLVECPLKTCGGSGASLGPYCSCRCLALDNIWKLRRDPEELRLLGQVLLIKVV